MKFATFSLDIARCSLQMEPGKKRNHENPIDRSGAVRVSHRTESDAAHGCHHRGDHGYDGKTFGGMHLGPAPNHSSGPNRTKEVNHYGREEEGCCKEACCQEEGRQEEVTTSSQVF